MKLLVIGANGQVGSELCLLESANFTIIGLGRKELDITNAKQIGFALTQNKPNYVINAAAYTAVDKAEEDVDKAYTVNRDGSMLLARACAEHDIPLIHISTDYVFAGDASVPYKEDDTALPINVYGKSKLEGEAQVRNHCPHHIILRTSWVFGCRGNNFVKTMLSLAELRDELSVVCDQYGCPTAAYDIAIAILKICEALATNGAPEKLWGTYHFTGSPATNWHAFAERIFATASAQGIKPPLLKAIPTSGYPTAAKRPRYTVLDCHKIMHYFGIVSPAWEDSLIPVIQSV